MNKEEVRLKYLEGKNNNSLTFEWFWNLYELLCDKNCYSREEFNDVFPMYLHLNQNAIIQTQNNRMIKMILTDKHEQILKYY